LEKHYTLLQKLSGQVQPCPAWCPPVSCHVLIHPLLFKRLVSYIKLSIYEFNRMQQVASSFKIFSLSYLTMGNILSMLKVPRMMDTCRFGSLCNLWDALDEKAIQQVKSQLANHSMVGDSWLRTTLNHVNKEQMLESLWANDTSLKSRYSNFSLFLRK
jgi:hypothetical protein